MEISRKTKGRLLWCSVLILLVLAISSSAAAARTALPPSQALAPLQPALDPNTPGIIALGNQTSFLYMTGSLPGTLGDAKWQWRAGNGAATRWWLDVSGGNLFLYSKRGTRWDSSRPTSASNFLALSVPLDRFQEWFWCGIRIYDRYRRFLGYGCDPSYGPAPESKGELAPWVEATVEESQPHVWQVLGAYCVIQRTEHIQIEPACPKQGDQVRVTISGSWGSGCPEIGHTLLTSGKHFQIEGALRSTPDVACPTVVTGWSFTEDLGQLEAGTYQILADMTDTETEYWSFEDQMTFDVASVPQ